MGSPWTFRQASLVTVQAKGNKIFLPTRNKPKPQGEQDSEVRAHQQASSGRCLCESQDSTTQTAENRTDAAGPTRKRKGSEFLVQGPIPTSSTVPEWALCKNGMNKGTSDKTILGAWQMFKLWNLDKDLYFKAKFTYHIPWWTESWRK